MLKPLELERGVARPRLAFVALERRRVGARERCPDGRACFLRLDQHEPPRLAVADGGRMAREVDQREHTRGFDRIWTKAAHVAPPEHEIAKAGGELGVELRRTRVPVAGAHDTALSMTWKNVPVTVPRREPHSSWRAAAASSTSASGASSLATRVA